MTALWSDLPAELLGLILLYLRCLADRVHFAAVCRSWRSAERQRAPPPQLPWLLLPSAANTRAVFSLLGDTTHRLFLPDDARGARCCGSFDGGWLVLALDQWHRYALLNLFSGARIALPDRLRKSNTDCESSMVIRSAALSAAPTSDGCVAAAIVSSATNLAFWRPGMSWWLAAGILGDVLEDVIYYKGEMLQGFHVLTACEKVLVYTPRDDGHGELVMKAYSIEPRLDHHMAEQRHNLHEPAPVCRYLVESRGKLLMVLRYSSPDHGVVRRTWLFKVYEMAIKRIRHGRHRASWVELDCLHGQVLFVGPGCSRAFQASQFDGFGEDCIYFMDDVFDISLVLKNDKQYSCSDMGMYSMKHRSVVSCFPGESPSGCSPPMWCFPLNKMS